MKTIKFLKNMEHYISSTCIQIHGLGKEIVFLLWKSPEYVINEYTAIYW
jgi:hypothetical protein